MPKNIASLNTFLKKYVDKKQNSIANNILNPQSKSDFQIRAFIEKHWQEQQDYIENFLKPSFYDFYAEFITSLFFIKEKNIRLYNKTESGKYPNAKDILHGPDFKVHKKRIWIECISVEKVVDEERLYRILERQNHSNIEKILNEHDFFLFNQIHAKYKKYKKYIDEDLVKKNDICIISISLHRISNDYDIEQVKKSIHDIFSFFKYQELYGILFFHGKINEEKYNFIKNPNNLIENNFLNN